MARRLATRGEGFYHLELVTLDVAAAGRTLAARGIPTIDRPPVGGGVQGRWLVHPKVPRRWSGSTASSRDRFLEKPSRAWAIHDRKAAHSAQYGRRPKCRTSASTHSRTFAGARAALACTACIGTLPRAQPGGTRTSAPDASSR